MNISKITNMHKSNKSADYKLKCAFCVSFV